MHTPLEGVFNVYSFTNVPYNFIVVGLDFAILRGGFAVSQSNIQVFRYLALRQCVVIATCAVEGRHRRVA